MPLADPMLLGHPWTFWLGWAWTLSSVVLTTWIVLQRRAPVSTLAWIMVLNLIRRPVIEWPNGAITVGFAADDWLRRLGRD